MYRYEFDGLIVKSDYEPINLFIKDESNKDKIVSGLSDNYLVYGRYNDIQEYYEITAFPRKTRK